jgi:hypothetical protein
MSHMDDKVAIESSITKIDDKKIISTKRNTCEHLQLHMTIVRCNFISEVDMSCISNNDLTLIYNFT